MPAIIPYVVLDSEHVIVQVYGKSFAKRPEDAISIPPKVDLDISYYLHTTKHVIEASPIKGHSFVYYIVSQEGVWSCYGTTWKLIRFESSRESAIDYAKKHKLCVLASNYNTYIGHTLCMVFGKVV